MEPPATETRNWKRVALIAVVAVAAIVTVAIAFSMGRSGDSDPQDRVPPLAAETDLTGTWSVKALVGADGNSVLPKSHEDVWLKFDDGKLTGSTGCNSVGGVYAQHGQNGQDISIPDDELVSTLVGCEQEAPLMARLPDVRHVSGSGDTRSLHAENWMIVVTLIRR